MRRRFVPILVAAAIFSVSLAGCKQPPPATPVQAPPIMSKTGPITESDLGVPVYPGSTANGDKSFIFQANGKQKGPSVKTTSVSLTTTDSVDQVEAFYRQKLGSGAKIVDHPSSGGKLVDIDYEKSGSEARIQIVPEASGSGSVIVILTQSKS